MITIILGMHRSGTSTFAGVLHLNKILMGNYKNFWPRPLAQNPKGFYENYDFRKINDQLLEEAGYTVKSYNSFIPELNPSKKILSKMKKIILDTNKKSNDWGWKDPRTCLTINWWIKSLEDMDLHEEVKIVFVSRNPSSVAKSLKTRNNLPISEGLEIWKAYTGNAINFCSKSNQSVFYCTFEQLLEDPILTCGKLFDFLNRKWDPLVVDKFIDRSISKSGKGANKPVSKEIRLMQKKISDLLS